MRGEGASQGAKKNKGTKRRRKKEGRGEWKAPFWLAVTHIHLPSFSGARSLLATGSLCERIPAFSQRQSVRSGRGEGGERRGRGEEDGRERGEKKGGVDGWTPNPSSSSSSSSRRPVAPGDRRSMDSCRFERPNAHRACSSGGRNKMNHLSKSTMTRI